MPPKKIYIIVASGFATTPYSKEEAKKMGRIDARGKSCPQPVMMTKTHVDAGERELEIYLDNAVSASNVQRYLEKNGFRVSYHG